MSNKNLHDKVTKPKKEKVNNMLRRSYESCSQNGVLCCNSDRARVQMTLTHHDAT